MSRYFEFTVISHDGCQSGMVYNVVEKIILDTRKIVAVKKSSAEFIGKKNPANKADASVIVVDGLKNPITVKESYNNIRGYLGVDSFAS